jgi:isopenicillin N synthase-like dioxygenase
MSNKNIQLGLAAVAAVAAIGTVYYLWSSGSNNQKEAKQSIAGTSGSKKETTPAPVAKKSDPILSLPVIDIALFFDANVDAERKKIECKKVAESLEKFGLVVLRDPRVSEEDNHVFLSMMERYFGQSDGVTDARPEIHYQVGVTTERIEKPRNHCKIMGAYTDENKPLSPCPPQVDTKWRFFWRIGPTPPFPTEFPDLNTEQVIPANFPEWTDTMNMWGTKMHDAVFAIAEMAAIGFGLEADAFTSRMRYGPHLLAPTGSDFNKYGAEGTVLAGFHYDLNFLTIHGKSRFPGLSVWTREGVKTAVTVPDGCLLVQAGKQIEMLTGGHVVAGFHEVVVSPATRKVIEDKQKKGESLWRVSSTLFSNIQSDQILSPLPPFNTPEAVEKYPPVKAGHQVSICCYYIVC